MSYFDNNSQFLQPVRFDKLTASHQAALQDPEDYRVHGRDRFLRQAYLIEMQLDWFGTNIGIPLDAIDWYEKHVQAGNIPYGIRLCSTYVSSRRAGAEELGETLTPVFFQIRTSKKDEKASMAIKVTLSFQEQGNDYRLIGFKDSVALYRGTEIIERWARYKNNSQPDLAVSWICEVSERTKKKKIPLGLYALSGSSFYNQIKTILDEYVEKIDLSHRDYYVTLARAVSRAIASMNRYHSAVQVAPLLMKVTEAAKYRNDLYQQGKSPDINECHRLMADLIVTLRSVNSEDPRVKELPQVK